MPVRDKVYEKMKSFGLTDSKEDFYKYYDSDENVRKDVFRRLKEDGLTDTEEEFYSYMQPSVVNNNEPDPFDANVERAKRGEPIQRVSTQSMIDTNLELGLSNSSYEYKPEVLKYILDNKPDIFKPKQSLMDAPLNTSAPEGSQEKFNERIGVAVKNLNDPTVQKGRTEAEFRGLNASVDEELKSIEDQITSRTKVLRDGNWKPGMPSTRDDSGLASLRGQRSYLEGAKELLEESEKIINASKDEKDGTFIGGVLRGTRDKVFDVDTWTMGLSDLVGGLRLKNVLEKVEKDEQLSSAEEKLLDAAVTNMAVNAYFASDLGRGYKAGQVFGESIPFMLEMAINPISASGNKLAKSLLKAGMKRFGSSINNNVAKATTRLATDALAATGMAATTGMPGVLGETVDRLNKNYNYGIDANGNLYAQKNGDVSFGEALGRSFTTRALENQSEMIFRAFDGAGELLKGVDATLPGGVNTFFDYIKNSKVGELWRGIKNSPLRKELAEATKVGGIGEEYLEEVYNNFANVALGEMSMEEALNLDNNIDTFLGLAPTQVMFSMLGLGNMAALRYKTRRDIEDLRATMNESQRQALDGLLAMGTTATNQDVREFIRNTMANQSLSIDEKRNAVKAAYDVARQKAMADVQEAEVEDKIAEENADIDAKTDPQTGNYGEVTLLGVDESGEPTANPANVFGAKVVDGELYLLVLPEGETEKKWVRPHEYDAESHQIMPGAEVKAYNEQMIRDNAAKQAEQEAKYAPDVLNAQMQQGIPFEDEAAVYVPFQVTPEGNAWQVEVYNKDENGKPSKDATGVNVITNDQFRDMLQAEYDRKEMQKPETEEPKQRGTVSTPVALAYLLEGGQNSIENLGYFLHGVAAAFPELENEIETIRGNIGEGLGVSPDRFAEVAPREMAEMRQVIESKYGKEGSTIFDELVANSTGYVPKVGAEMALRLENLKPIQNEGQQPTQEAAPTTEAEVTNTPVETEEVTQAEEVQPEVVAEEESKEPTLEEFVATLPKTKNNEIDYSALTPQQQFQYTSMTESPEVALEDLQSDIAAGQAEIAKTREQLAKVTGGKRAELRDKVRKLTANNAELQSFYDSVAPKQEATVAEEKPTETTLAESAANFKPQASKADREAKPKPKRKNIVSKKKVDSDFTYEELKPVNGVELAAEQLAAGNIKITIESYKKETGHGEKERKKMGLTPFRSLDKGGMSIERAAEKLVEEDEANHNGHIFNGDTMSARDAIIELLSMSEKWSDVTDYIKNIRLDERKKREEAEYEEYAEYLMLNLDVTPEEYESLNEAEEQRIIALREVIEELDIIFAEAELERQQSIKEYEQGTNVTGNQGQSELLSETRIGNTGGNQGNESQRGTIESGGEVERNSETSQTKESAEVAPSIEQTNVSRMADIEARILEIEGRRNEISDELEAVEDTDVMSIAELRAEEYELNQEQAELEAEYIGLRSMNDESNAISESEGSGLYFRTTTKNEEARRKPLRQRAKEWEQKLGVKVNIIENFDDVTNKDAKKAIRNGQRVTGWYEESTGEVCLYMPYLESAQEIDATYIHEVVAHKGLRGLLGDKFDEFLDDVWNAMSEADKLIYLTYPGVNGNKRAAADEYIAHLAENIDVTESAWGKLAELIKKFLKAIGLEPKMTHADIANTIKLSYQRLLSGEGGAAENVSGIGERFRISENTEEFDQMMKLAIKNKGYVFPNLDTTIFPIINIPYHSFTGESIRDTKENARYFMKTLKGERKGIIDGKEVLLMFNNESINKIPSDQAISKSKKNGGFLGGHLAVAENIFKVLNGSRDVEIHPNVFKTEDGRRWSNGYDKSVLCHRYYSAVSVDGDEYRVMVMVKEHRPKPNKHQISPYTVEVQAFEIEKAKLSEVPEGIYTTNWGNASDSFTYGANLLNGVEKSYDKGKKLLDESGKTLFRTVYHGSAASFDKFDHSFMGTGEGAQSYGWGTYVTEVNGIARSYAQKLAPTPDDIKYIGDFAEHVGDDVIRIAKSYLFDEKYDLDKAKERVQRELKLNMPALSQKGAEFLLGTNKEDWVVPKPKRHLYEVDIPDNDGYNYLGWFDMLSDEQLEGVRKAMRNSDEFKRYAKKYGREIADARLDNWTNVSEFKYTYNYLQNFVDDGRRSDKVVSEILSNGGFVGIEYPAQATTGGREDNAKNYVIFDEKDLDIKEHTRFRVVTDKNGKKTLVGLHNISEQKLRKAIKQGGLANPSVAVIDMDKQSHVDYGDITLVLPASMIDKKTGKNVGTYLADAYTPVYPTVVKKMSDKGAKALTKALESVDETFRSKVRTYFNSYLDSGTIYDALAYWYLSDTGKNPPILEAALPDGFTREEVEKVKSVNPEADSFYQLSEEEKQKALNLYADKFFGGMKEYKDHLADYSKRMQEVVKDESKPQMVRKNIQENLNSIERYGYEYDRVANYFKRAIFIADRQSQPSEMETFRNAFEEVTKNGLEEDFGNWLIAKEEELGVEEKLFAGYDNQGRAKYLPNTLENASKLMKKEGRAGATGLGGFNYFVAILAPVAKTTKQISAKKGNLSTQEEYDKFVEEWKNYYHDLARQLQPGAGKWDDYGYHRLHEIAPMANPKAYVKKEYGIDLSDEFLKDLNDVKNAIKNDFPARYFETKFERPVYLNEVAAAVVPNDMSLDLYGQLQRMGIPMYEYERGNNEARMAVVDKVTIDNEGIRFRFIGEQGARNLDKAEEATTRLDNLAVAREMETAEKDAKTIKMATGWERGADGLWRYETMDSETAIKDGDEVEIRKQIEDIEEEEKSYKKKAKAEGIDADERYEAYIGFNRRRGFLEAQLAYVMVKNADVLTHIDVSLYHVLDKENSENLFKAYPELEFVRVGFATEIHGKSLGATIINGSKIEAIHLDVKRSTPEELNGYLAHEIQHAIQEIEGFAPGGNPSMESPRKAEQKTKNISFMKDKLNKSVSERNSLLKQRNEINDKMSAWWDAHEDATREDMLADKDMQQYNREYDDLSKQIDEADKNVKFNERWLDATLQANTALGYEGYKKLAGEVEARNVSRRMMLSADDRRNMLAVETEDVAREDQIFLMDGMESGISDRTRFRIAPQEEVQAEVDKFTSKYNGKEVVVLNSTVSDEELESLGLDVEDVREAIEKETEGFYDPITDKIYIFADIADADELEKTLFHENGHGIFRKNKKFVNEFNENSKDKFKNAREVIKEYYKEHERAEELFVRIFDQELTSGNFEYLPKYLSEELWNEFNDILKDFGYDRQEESDRRRKGSVVRTETDRGSEKETDVRNSDIEPNQREERKEKGRSKEQAERLKKLFDDVADMGLRGVLGNTNYDLAMLDIFYALPEKERTDVAVRAVKIGGDVAVAVDEFLNNVEEPTLWEKAVAAIKNALRKVGIDVQLTENDVKYLLWRSRKPLNRNSIFDMAEDIDMRRKLKVGKFDNDPTDGGDTPGGGTRFRSSDNTLEQIKQARKEIEGNPSESQKEAGNYKKGHITLDGFDITLENPKGGVRSGVDKNGKKWSITMNNDYGYIRGTEAVDGDHIDVFLSDNPTEGNVFVVDQSNEDGSFDESKVMYGFNSLDEARDAYLSNYKKGWEKRIMDITEVSKDEFKKWIDSSHKKTKAFSEYKNVNPEKSDTRFRVANKLQIRDEYESTIKKGGYQAREAVQDAMLSLRRTQELIEKASGKKLRGFENAWEHENRLSSVVQAEIHEMERKFYKPMMDAVKKLAEAMGDKNDYAVADYLMLKHGIERNREMAVRKALTDTEGKIDRTQLEQWYKDKDAIRNDANLPTWREKQEAMYNAALNYGADMSVDYSGLTSMFGSDDLADCTDKAYKEVESIEKKYPSETKALGKAVKALNQSTIDKSFESGLLDRKVRDELKNDMYDYYVPLRGFDEVTSDEVYSYLDNDRNAFNAPLRRAKGRTSKADNPIAYMKSIAESGIMQGERNKMKQSFLNMVTNHPSDLVSVREGVWVVLNPATGEWEAASMPTIPNNATPADVQSILEAWEASMEQQAATNPNIKKISEGADIPYRVIGNRMEQHQVIVKRNGKSYTLTVNGNPRLAMALNGLTNPNNTSKDGRVAADIQKAVDKMNRTLAAWYTTRNPDFVASNFMRDTFYTNTIVRAKEGNKYANKFHKHYAELLMPGKMLSLFNKYENGKLDMNNETEKAFYDFIMNGGETGYSNLKDIEHIKNEIANQLKGDRLKWFRQVSDKLDLVNRAVENTSRFAAFLTSREMGRDMSKSIFDAKEISVNFNKKGAGGTFYKGTGQTKFGNLAAMVGAGGRGLYVFFNAAIQGSTNLLHVMKVNPKGTSAGLAAMFLMGAVLPYLLSGDDDKDYYDLPDHVRRNHLVLPGAGDTWVSIPLPIEYRIMYGMGELFTSWRTGHERGSNVALKALSLTGQALPLNFLEEGLDAFVPSALSPLWQAYNNRSWTGLPIYKDNEFNKDDPEYTKAYKNVDRLIYNFTKSLYDWTFDEENQEEGIDLNPAVIESLARGYFGGLFTQMSNIVKTAETIGGDREFDWRNIPVGNRIFKSGDERTKEKRITNEYFDNMGKLDFLESRRRMLNRTIDGKAVPEEDVEKAKEDLEQMMQTGVYQKYMKFKEYKKVADKIRKAMKDNGSTEELQRKLSEAQEKANEVLR